MRLITRIGLITIGLIVYLSGAAVRAEVVAVVANVSPITALSQTQLIDIFLGKRTRFPDGSSAVPIDQIEGSPTRHEFYAKFAAMSPAQIKAYWSKIIFTGRGQPPKAVANSVEAKKLVLTDLNAISYIDLTMVDDSVRVVFGP